MLIITLIVVAALTVIGRGVEDRLKPTQLFLPGTQTQVAKDLLGDRYGDSVVLQLTGPAGQLDRQGPALVAAVNARPRTRVLSPWTSGSAGKALRPTPRDAVLIVDLRRTGDETASSVLPPLRRFAEARVEGGIKVHLSGVTEVGREYNDVIVRSIHGAEKLALPILLIVLLLVFRAPIAALIPALVAGGTVLASNGVIAVLTRWLELDAITLNMVSMIGLALGVDYSLLLVSRFREELARGHLPAEAAERSVLTAGRTAAFAGFVLVALMAVIIVMAPGSVMISTAVGATVVATVGVLGAVLVTPAAVRLLGARIDAWRIGPPPNPNPDAGDGGRLGRIVTAVTRRPRRSLALAAAACLIGLIPAIGYKTIPPDPRQLPPDNPALVDFRDLRRAGFGPEITVALRSPDGPLTDARRLRDIGVLQDRISRLKYVRFVAGPADVARQADDIGGLDRGLRNATTQLSSGQRQLGRLDRGLNRAGDGVDQVRGGLKDAADGAGRLVDGGTQADDGASALAAGARRADDGAGAVSGGTSLAASEISRLENGLRRAEVGARKLLLGTRQASDGARRLNQGSTTLRNALRDQLLPGAQQLADGLSQGRTNLARLREPAQITTREARAALDALNRMSVGKVDPDYIAAYRATATALGAASGVNPVTGAKVRNDYDGLDPSLAGAGEQLGTAVDGATRLRNGLDQAAAGAGRLTTGSRDLRRGLRRIERGQKQLLDGIRELRRRVSAARPDLQRLRSGAGELATGVTALSNGAGKLDRGLGRLTDGQRTLRSGLQDGVGRSAPLATGLDRARRGVEQYRSDLARTSKTSAGQIGQLRERSPTLFRSGFLTVAALDGAAPLDRAASSMLIDLPSGGTVGRIVVLPNLPTNDPRTTGLIESIRSTISAWQPHTGIDAAAGGAASQLSDFDQVTRSRLPLLGAAMSLVTLLMLMVVLRSLLLPLLAVVLNLVTVGIAVGVLTLLFVGDDPPLGGAGSLDVLMLSAVFAITYALSIDYQVFLLSRMREGYVRRGTNAGAIEFGVRRTASIVTGAALIMVSVFAAFTTAEFVAVKQLGIGLAVAVIIDATLVRLVLLPAAMTLMGERTWWLPEWLDQRLPHVDVEGTSVDRPAETTDDPALAHAGGAA